MTDLLIILPIFLLAGFVKGVAGFGLPTVSIALLALARPLPEAMALMLVPSLTTNSGRPSRAGSCGRSRRGWAASWPARRSGPMRRLGCWRAGCAGAVGAAGGGAGGVLGAGAGRTHAARAGAAHGTLARAGAGAGLGGHHGADGQLLVPAAQWLQAIRLPREQFVQGFGLGVVVAHARAGGRRWRGAGCCGGARAGLGGGVLPAFAGMEAGRRLRTRLDEAAFRRVVQVALGVLGAWLVVRAFG